MKTTSLTYYILNCLLLLVPIMAWNMIFFSKLPYLYSQKAFEKNIPTFVLGGENISWLLVFVLPLLMPLRIETQSQRLGLWVYAAGAAIYFVSWLMQMYFSRSAWSLSAFGFLAPAYTPLIWLIGISLIGSTFYFSSPYRSGMYITIAIIFICFHLSHAITVYQRSLS